LFEYVDFYAIFRHIMIECRWYRLISRNWFITSEIRNNEL